MSYNRGKLLIMSSTLIFSRLGDVSYNRDNLPLG